MAVIAGQQAMKPLTWKLLRSSKARRRCTLKSELSQPKMVEKKPSIFWVHTIGQPDILNNNECENGCTMDCFLIFPAEIQSQLLRETTRHQARKEAFPAPPTAAKSAPAAPPPPKLTLPQTLALQLGGPSFFIDPVEVKGEGSQNKNLELKDSNRVQDLVYGNLSVSCLSFCVYFQTKLWVFCKFVVLKNLRHDLMQGFSDPEFQSKRKAGGWA